MIKGLFITGTDTDVGKTIVTAALLRTFLNKKQAVVAFKPIQTGCNMAAACSPSDDAQKNNHLEAPDLSCYASAIADISNQNSKTYNDLSKNALAPTLFKFVIPCSPHLAAESEGVTIDLEAINAKVQSLQNQALFTLVEGAGGVYVPLNAEQTILDLISQSNLPVVIVADNKVGVINQVLLTVNALEQKGLELAAVVLNQVSENSAEQHLILEDNAKTIKRLSKAPFVIALPHFKELATTITPQILEKLTESFSSFVDSILNPAPQESNQARLDFDQKHIWHPYSSATTPLAVHEVKRAQGSHLYLQDGTALVDGMSSWWCAIHGYSHPRLIKAMNKQINKMSHVMFGGLTHQPAIELAQKILALTPNKLEHIFFSDSGSVSIEVALKMALQYWQNKGQTHKNCFITPCGGYHGDTLGAMSVCDPVNGMHSLFTGMLAKQVFIERPACRFDQEFDPKTLDQLEAQLEKNKNIAGLILEPIVQGAGGMWFYHPEYLLKARKLCDKHQVLLIVDEIATGFGRTGKMFGSNWSGIEPDIMCIGKALTGGCLSLAATLASADVAQGISAKGGVFMHGPTFMANPLACAVASESIALLLESSWQANIAKIESTFKAKLEVCKNMAGVNDVRILGAIAVIELKQAVNMSAIQKIFMANGAWIRPFGKLVYLMPAYSISEPELDILINAVIKGVEAQANS